LRALYCFGVPLLVVLDQLTKQLALRFLKTIDTFPLWHGVFHLTYCENRGAAFGILQNQFSLFYVVTAVVVILATVYMFKTRPRSFLLSLSITLLVGGALGNLVDRVMRGFVVDFLDFCLINFPIFNVADCFVMIGAVLLALYVIFWDGPPEKQGPFSE